MIPSRTAATLAGIVFIVCIGVVIVAQQQTGWLNLGLMVAGLIGLIVLLALYNRRYR